MALACIFYECSQKVAKKRSIMWRGMNLTISVCAHHQAEFDGVVERKKDDANIVVGGWVNA